MGRSKKFRCRSANGCQSHVYAAILQDPIRRHQTVEHLHLSDVLIALRNAGYDIDRRTGLLAKADLIEVASAAE